MPSIAVAAVLAAVLLATLAVVAYGRGARSDHRFADVLRRVDDHLPVTSATGIVEWRPDETAESLDARTRATAAHASVRSVGARGGDEHASLGAPGAG